MRRQVLVVGLLLAMPLAVLPWAAGQTPSHLPHPPIVIASNADFQNPANGVRSGSGSEADPYVIEGWEIDYAGFGVGPESDTGIRIQDTTAYVVVRDCVILDDPSVRWTKTGLVVGHASNVAVEDLRIEGHARGIVVNEASSVRLANSTIGTAPDGGSSPGAVFGVEVFLATDVAVDGLEVYGHHMGMAFQRTSAARVANSTLNGYAAAGVHLSDTEETVVDGNTFGSEDGGNPTASGLVLDRSPVRVTENAFLGNSQGVAVSHSEGAVLERNDVAGSRVTGIELYGDGVTVGNNTVRDGMATGVLLYGDSNRVLNNTVVRNGGAGIRLAGQDNLVANNTVSANGGAGFVLDGGLSAGNVVRGNDFRENGGADILVNGRIGSNRFEDNLGRMERAGSVFAPAAGLLAGLVSVLAASVAWRRAG